MSLLTDAAAVIAQMRIATAHAEGGVAGTVAWPLPGGHRLAVALTWLAVCSAYQTRGQSG